MVRSLLLWFKASAGTLVMALATPFLAVPAVASTPLPSMPPEYKEVMAIVNRLAAANDLGDRELAFTIVVGEYGAWLAADLGLCKADDCSYYFSLNPFVRHRNEVGEIVRQAYLYGDANAQAHTNGTIEIPRVTFRVYGVQKDYLACTIAHEIAHARDAHVYQHNEVLSTEGGGMNPERKKLFNFAINRQFEILADQQAWEMTVRAGYPADLCEKDLLLLHRSSGSGGVTEPDSSHPGVQERIERLNAYRAEKEGQVEPQPPTLGRWIYDPDLNVLRFLPPMP